MKGPKVWAPKAHSVELVSGERRIPLHRSEDGTFQTTEQVIHPGSDYAFSLDGGPPLPDPRSREQPAGIHAPSRVPSDEFRWTDSGFRAKPLASAVIYEAHVGTFAEDGTFDGVIDRLSHLSALGVTHLELMPIAAFPGNHGWGYDGVFPFAPHRGYGGAPALKRLVDACHARDIAIVLDVVYNHLGPDGNVLPRFGPYLHEVYHTPWGAALNLDGPYSTEVRRFLIDNALYWLSEFHFDGLRLDAVHELFDRSARHFLRQLSEEVAELSARLAKPLVLIAESDLNDPRLIQNTIAGGYGLDAQWSDDFHHALHRVLTGEQQGYYSDFRGLPDLARALTRGFVYDGQYSHYRKRHFGQPLDGVSLRRLVGYMQNHDQIGNRARGERIGHQVSARRVRLGAALVLLGPFVPMLFQGEEWNASAPFLYFTDHENDDLARATRDGRRNEFAAFGWKPEEVPDPQAPETYRASCLDFREIEQAEHANMLEFYRTLLRFRRERPEFAQALVRVRCDEQQGFLVMERERSRVAVNFGEATAQVRSEPDSAGARAEVLYSTEGAHLEGENLVLPPESLAIVVNRS